jgi:hypothetical protein
LDGGWNKSHNEELCNWYSLLNVRVIKSGRGRLEYLIASVEQMRNENCIQNAGYKPGREQNMCNT